MKNEFTGSSSHGPGKNQTHTQMGNLWRVKGIYL